jgi:hypothetical protein
VTYTLYYNYTRKHCGDIHFIIIPGNTVVIYIFMILIVHFVGYNYKIIIGARYMY